jgi:hypothetical protein
MKTKLGWLAVVVVVAGTSGEPAWSQQTSGIKAGILTCNVDSGWGFVFGSTRDLKCTYADNNGSAERYGGHISKFGVDLGYHAGGIVAWAVLAPTSNIDKGALAGTYGGVTGGAAVGVGAGANVLIGGTQRSVALQPISVEGMTGINVAAGIASMELKSE